MTRRLAEARKSGELPWLRPDGKSQVSIEYDEQWKPVRAEALVISTQHSPDVDNETIDGDVKAHIIRTIVEIVDPKVGETVYDPAALRISAALPQTVAARLSKDAVPQAELPGSPDRITPAKAQLLDRKSVV